MGPYACHYGRYFTISLNLTLQGDDNLIIAVPVTQNYATNIEYTGVVKPIVAAGSGDTNVVKMVTSGASLLYIYPVAVMSLHGAITP
jgi:hypothetical protein